MRASTDNVNRRVRVLGLLSALIGKTKSSSSNPEIIDATANGIAQCIADVYSAAEFERHFGDEHLAVGWSESDALAAWYSLGNLALVISVWQHYREHHRASTMIDLVRSKLTGHWAMPDATFERLTLLLEETEEQSVRSFNSCRNGQELSRFFGRYVSLILGAPVPFTDRSDFEYELLGVQHLGKDPAKIASLTGPFVSLVTATKRFLKTVRA